MTGLEIKSIELFKVPPRWLFVKITTENGLFGWGEPVVEGRASTVEACVEEMKSFLIGHPANKIEDIWQMVFRGGFYRGGPVLMSALSGVDQALWDIKGKTLGVPIYELLGGAVRNKMRIYGWVHGETPADCAKAAIDRLEAGFRAVKMNVTNELEWIETPKMVNQAVERVAAVREAVGDEIAIGIDFHGRVHKGMTKIYAKALEPLMPSFYEELLLSENNDGLESLKAFTSIPIATGERMYSRWDFKEILQKGQVDIIQPDLSHAGGISEVKRIANMAEAYDVSLAPHCPLGPISLASAFQVDFSCLNAVIQETSLGIHYGESADLLDYMANPEVFDVKEGFVSILENPGLGIEIDEDKVRAAAEIGHSWKSPIWRNEDGSVTEW
ncbi:MAG: galactonate dehydratase [Reichenbachiella sp.]